MKVAIVCDWLTNVGGAEKVILRIHKLFPEAPIYTSKYDPRGIDWFKDATVHTGWLQIFPTALRRILGPLRQRYFSKLDLSGYDLVISVTGAEAKSVKAPDGIHISYCHVPTQYYWQMYDDYVKNPGFGIFNPVVRFFFKLLVKPLRRADYKAAENPDYFVTISEYAKEMIKKYYNRDSVVVHPPVEIKDFSIKGKSSVPAPEDYYIVTSRQVNWKRIDLAVDACLKAKKRLLVIGDGPEHGKLVKMAQGSRLIEFLPIMDKKNLAKHLMTAKGYLFPSMEPFGIAPVEALAAGCPVIAYGEGGAKDYVVGGENGILFDHQTSKSLEGAIIKFEKTDFDRQAVSETADSFDEKRFDQELKNFIKKAKKQRHDEKDH